MKKSVYLLSYLALAAFLTGLASTTGAISTPQDDRTDLTRRDLVSFDQFLDKNPKIGAELKQNPSLIENRHYLNQHAILREYLTNYPRVREEMKEHPGAFLAGQRSFDINERHEATGRDITPRELESFDQFLDKNPKIARELQQNPRLADNEQYLDEHEELRGYLTNHPRAREEIKEHPGIFLNRGKRFERQQRERPEQPRNEVKHAPKK